MKRALIVAMFLVLASKLTLAADVWVLQGGAGGGCHQLQWTPDTLFLNTGSAPAVVRLLGMSDGPDEVVQRTITIAPMTLTSLRGTAAFAWRPSSAASAFYLHLDVPPDVVVSNVLNVGLGDCDLGTPQGDVSAVFGSVKLPRFDVLNPAGQTRYILGSDLGLVSARTNVGVYNAGSETAVADVQLLRGCDGQVLDRATFTLAPNSSRQISLNPRIAGACTARPVQDWVNYVTINVSQHSLSYVANIVNNETPRVLIGVQ
jgi:hypothetical protein